MKSYKIIVGKCKDYENHENNNCFFFKVAIDNFIYYGDEFIAAKCGMNKYDYHILLQRKYNGSLWDDDIIFLNEADAFKAKDYLQSILLARQLADV